MFVRRKLGFCLREKRWNCWDPEFNLISPGDFRDREKCVWWVTGDGLGEETNQFFLGISVQGELGLRLKQEA